MDKIFITGTSSGIGNFLAKNLKTSFEIFGVSRQENTIFGINHFVGDINDENFLFKIFDSIGKIDFLILNAGVGYFDRFKNISVSQNREMINTNLLSQILLTSIFFSKIKKGIIFIGSVCSKKSFKYGAVYSASKFGVRGFAMNLKNESNLKIHIINPKIVNTSFHKNSKLAVDSYKTTKLEDIFFVVKNIIIGNENRFEIDL